MMAIGESPGRGRGVFAARHIRSGELIEEAPVLVVPPEELEHLERTTLRDYYFLWGTDERAAALLLGLCSLCNHSYTPNTAFETRPEEGTIRFVALRDISVGEEITTNYNGRPDSQKPVWFEVRPD